MPKQGWTQDSIRFPRVIPDAGDSELFGAEICTSVSSHAGP
jgi:hypothetical protein